MHNSEYWQKRFTDLTDAMLSHSEAFYKAEIEKEFKKAMAGFEKDLAYWYEKFSLENSVSMAEAKKILKGDSLQEFQWSVEEYIKNAEEKGLDPAFIQKLRNASAKYHVQRIEVLRLALQNTIEQLYTNTDKALETHLIDLYETGFLHTAYEIDKGTGLKTKFKVNDALIGIDANKITAIISRPWVDDGLTFSDRLWRDKEELNRVLKNELVNSVIRGDDFSTAVKMVRQKMGVANSAAARLVMTESAFFASKSQHDCFSGLGVEKFEFIATLDLKTSTQCREHDGKVYDMKDFKIGVNAPPLHCWCRSCTCPYFDDEEAWSGERAARDPKTGKTIHVPADMKYSEWEEKFVDKTDIQAENEQKRQQSKSKNVIIKISDEAKKIIQRAKNLIEYNGVELYYNAPMESEIISNLGGGDLTSGSCASLSLCYIGQKKGLNALDFRGGESQSFFAAPYNLRDIAQLVPESVIDDVKGANTLTFGKNLLSRVEEGKEYWLCCACHSAIVRKKDGILQYLELQSGYHNGWIAFDENVRYTLKKRFGAKSTQSMKYLVGNFLVDLEKFTADADLREILGYINTAKNKQKKGVEGYAK